MENESRFTFIWAIENSSYLISNCSLFSPVFSAKSLEMTKWHLILCHFTDDATFFFEVRREEEDDGPESIKVALNISLLGADGLPLLQVNTGVEKFSRNSSCCLEIPDNGNVFWQRRSEHLSNDILTVRCRMWCEATDISKRDLCFARTHMGKDQHFFVWPITGFSSLQAGEKRIRLLKPSSAEAPEVTLNFSFKKVNGSEYASFNINCKDVEKLDSVTGEIAVIDTEGAVVHSEKCEIFIPEDKEIWKSKNFFEKQQLLSLQSNLLFDDVLFLRCKFEVSVGPVWSKIENCQQLDSSEMPVMATDLTDINFKVLNNNSMTESCPFTEIFAKFYEESTLTDVVLQTNTESFAVHRIVLSCRSAVFGGMLSKDSHGNLRKIIHMPGIETDTLRYLISYMYKGEVPKLEWEDLADLFRAATTFELLELKQECCSILKSQISESNVCSLLSLADLYGEEELFKKVLNFILKNSDILKSDAWNTFKMKNARLALEATERIISRLVSSNRLRRLYV